MNIEKTREKLKTLSYRELKDLLELVCNEYESRPKFYSNRENNPRDQCKALEEFFGNAWIH